MKEARLHITPGMQKILDYPRFAGPPRMLVLATEYFFDASWLRAARQLGWEAQSVPSVMVGNMTREHIERLFTALGAFRPDFVLTSNYAGMDMHGLFARFFEDARIPYVSWFTDTPRMILYDREIYTSHYAVAATWERAYTPHFKELGFHHIHYMPLATDPTLFQGTPRTEHARPLAFVGTSMAIEAAEAWEKVEEHPALAAAIRNAFGTGRVTRERFAEGMNALLDPDLLASLDKRHRRHAELCVVYEATRRQRRTLVERMVPYDIEVRGDAPWQEIAPRAGGSVAYHSDLASYYRETAINLNTTSLQMKSAVNQRVFDCPAAGGFLISDAQEDLLELFDPDEACTYETLDELEDKVRYFRARPAERSALIERAQRRIEAHHTHACRLRDLVAFMKERYA